MSRYRLEMTPDAEEVPKRIALIRREQPARLTADRGKVVTTAPHLLIREVLLVQLCIITLAILALAFDAPLEGVADPQRTPNPAKASWYFLGLQELLHYFPPVVAGVLVPTLVLLALAAIPYMRVNWETEGFYERQWKRRLAYLTLVVSAIVIGLSWFHAWPVVVPTVAVYITLALPALPFCPIRLRRRLSSVPLANWIMTWFVLEAALLTLIGIFFRGPGWSWTWPWIDGLY